MRSAPEDYLEAEKLRELADDLVHRGYQVERDAKIGAQVFDLVAQRANERIVFEVKARSRLKEASSQVANLRAAAQAAGVRDFRLVVVNAPREVDLIIEDFELELANYFVEHGLPGGLDEISSATIIEGVSGTEFSRVDIRRSGIHVQGDASLDVQLNYGGGALRDGVTQDESFPITFDVDLDTNLKLAEVHTVTVDLSGFDGEGDGAG